MFSGFLFKQWVLTGLLLLGCVTSVVGQHQLFVGGKWLSVNQHDTISTGLFGVHEGNFQGLDSATVADWGIESVRTIEVKPSGNASQTGVNGGVSQNVTCWFDRFTPPLLLSRNDWKAYLQQKASKFVNSVANANSEVILEFWNEPYLNWAYKPGVAFDPRFYQTNNLHEGDSVYLQGSNTPLKLATWKRKIWFESPIWAADPLRVYNAVSQAWNWQLGQKGIPYPGLTGALLPGESYYVGTNKEFHVVDSLVPHDPTQHSFYAGKQLGLFYNQMLSVLADTLANLNPNLKLAAGWGFEVHKDNWTPWNNLFKPIIDNYKDEIFAIHEHHYGMDTRIIAADYETMWAYAKYKYNKHLKFINTETGGFLDPQRPAEVANNPGNASDNMKALMAYRYNFRDVVYLLQHSPDKAYARAVHEPQKTNGGVEAMFKALKPLRGRLLYTQTNNPNIITAAAYQQQANTIAVAILNNDTLSANINVNVVALPGTQICQLVQVQADTNNGFALQTSTHNLPTPVYTFMQPLLLNAGQAVVITAKLQGTVQANTPTASRTQFVVDTVLVTIPANSSQSLNVALPAIPLANAQTARLKLALFNCKANAQVVLNGQPLQLNYQGGDAKRNLGGLSYAQIPNSLLGTQNTLTFTTTTDSASLWCASIELLNGYKILNTPKQHKNKQQFTFYPNPVSGTLNIETNSPQPTQIELLGLQGNLLRSTRITHHGQLNLYHLPPGLYLLRTTAGTQTGVYKLVIE